MKALKLFNSIFEIKTLDKVTYFRLLNAFIVAISLSIIAPAMITLKGTLMLPWIIAVFSIASTLSVKTNAYISSFGLNKVYHAVIVSHLFLILSTFVYFWNPVAMVYLDSISVIIETAIMSAYSILLTNYITDNYPDSMHKFQILRNNIWADGTLIGLGLSTIIMFYFGVSGAVWGFLIFNIPFSMWLIYNWNFFKDIEND